jgi:hypothetical protein
LLESLEDRTLLACNPNPFAELAQQIQGVSPLQAAVTTALNGASQVPLLFNKANQNGMLGEFDRAKVFTSDLLNRAQAALNSLSGDATDAQIRNAVYLALGPNDLNLLGVVDPSQADVPSKYVVVTHPNGPRTVGIELVLHKDVTISQSPAYKLDLGLSALPFQVQASGGFQVAVGFDYAFKFGFDSSAAGHDYLATCEPNKGFFLDTKYLDDFGKAFPHTQLLVHASAGLTPNASIRAIVGFLQGTLTNASPPTNVSLDFKASRLIPGQTPTFAVAGDANVRLHLDVGFAGAANQFPSIGADLVLGWSFGGGNPPPTVAFQNVTVNMGSALSNFLEPIVGYVQTATKPLQPILDFLGTPIPGLDDLRKVVGAPNEPITPLYLIKQLSGQLPPNLQAVARLLFTLRDIITVLNSLKTDSNQVGINFGSFNVSGNLRGLSALDPTTTNNLTDPILRENLSPSGGSFGRDQLNAQLGSFGAIGQRIRDFLNTTLNNGLQFQLPILDDPMNSVFKLLLGQDPDLVTVSFQFGPRDVTVGNTFNAFGLSIGFQGTLRPDLYFELGYDTHGIRRFLREGGNPVEKFLDGFWLAAGPNPDQRTHLTVGATLEAAASVSVGVFSAGVSGGLRGNFDFHLNGPQKLRPSEILPCSFAVSGSLEAFLQIFARVGVELPIIGFVGFETRFDIAKSRLVDLSYSCIGNPFQPPPSLRLAMPPGMADANPSNPQEFVLRPAANGVLTLNMGPSLLRSQRNFQTLQTDENFTITHDNPRPVDPPNTEAVIVSAFGYSQRYAGVSRIVANAGDGNDTIIINPGVTSPAELRGGTGTKQLTYGGSGEAFLDLEQASGTAVGGSGLNHLYGGVGNSTLVGGDGPNYLYGGDAQNVPSTDPGNVLIGGRGANRLYGGKGKSKLIGGCATEARRTGTDCQNDFFRVAEGENTLVTGLGTATVMLDGGTNTVTWKVGNANLTVNTPPEPNGRNSLQLGGSDNADTFTIDPFNVTGVRAQVASAGGYTATVTVDRVVQVIGIDGGRGADRTVIRDLGASTWVKDIGVNNGEALDTDGARDVTEVWGAPDHHTLNVVTDSVWLHPRPPSGAPAPMGGVTMVQTRPQYQCHVALTNYTGDITNYQDDLFVYARGAQNTVNVQSTTGHTVIHTDAGSDTFNVFSAALPYPNPPERLFYVPPAQSQSSLPLLFGQRGLLELRAGPGANTLTISGQQGSDPIQATLTDSAIFGTVQRPGSPLPPPLPFRIQYSATGSFAGGIRLRTGTGADSVTVVSTPAGVPTVVATGGGADQVVVGDAGNTLDSIRGALTIDGGNGPGTVTFNDQGLAVPGNYLLTSVAGTGNILSRNGQSFVYKDLGGMVLNAGHHNNTLAVRAFSGTAATLNAGNGSNSLLVGDAAGGNQLLFDRPLTLNGQSGSNTLTINDQGNNVGQVYTLTANTLTRSGIAPISYSQVQQFTLHAAANGNILAIQGTAAGTTYAVTTGAGIDQIILGSAANSLDALQGALSLDGQGGSNTLVINDQGTNTPNLTYTLNAATFQRTGTSSVSYANVQSVTLNTGSGVDTVNVLSTGGPLAINTFGGGQDVVALGNVGSVQGIQGAVTIGLSGQGTTQVRVDDSADLAARSVTMATAGLNGTISGLLPGNAVITYALAHVAGLTVTGGQGGNTFVITGTGDGFPTTVNPGVAGDQVFVQASSATAPLRITTGTGDLIVLSNSTNALDGIGPVSVSDPTNSSTLVANDSGYGGVDGYTLTASAYTIGRSSNFLLTFGTPAALALYGAGAGGNVFTLTGTPAGTAVAVNPGPTGDQINIQGSAATGSVTVNTGTGDVVTLRNGQGALDGLGSVAVLDVTGSSAVVADDSGYGGNDDYVLVDLTLTIARSPGFLLTYSGIAQFSLTGGSGSEFFDLDTTSVPTTVQGGSGGNHFHISPFTQYLAGIVGPLTLQGSSTDILEFFDTNNPSAETYAFDSIPSMLTLATVPGFAANWTGMGTVVLETNGMSTVQDPSNSVLVDPAGGPPSPRRGAGKQFLGNLVLTVGREEGSGVTAPGAPQVTSGATGVSVPALPDLALAAEDGIPVDAAVLNALAGVSTPSQEERDDLFLTSLMSGESLFQLREWDQLA